MKIDSNECRIYIDNPNNKFIGGQTVAGRVELNFDSEKIVRGISIEFKGKASCYWTESNSDNSSDSYYSDEKYFKEISYLVGKAKGEILTIPPGQYTYPFSYVLPENLPPSFEGDHGNIRYTVKVNLDRPLKIDQSAKAAFIIDTIIDRNDYPPINEPATLTMEKYFNCCLCKSGPLTGILKLPFTGFHLEQTIPFIIEIDNASDTRINKIKIRLNQVTKFYASSRRENVTKKKLNSISIDCPVRPKHSAVFDRSIEIPKFCIYNLARCSIIDLIYEIEVVVISAGVSLNMTGNIPIYPLEPNQY